ncbi:myb domain-containing protein, putative [Babesia ovata]|uniref:Myb domain-containing protein, putative n=1 Tax=Babesia ovata TaxID=189622 RepID=A0A2H6KDQ3_9APIC|nr:myb domain-containing protein, putative [Babesia ovata]GBE61128.1 myb domain-containing protein, putative [Babesia ovata]
MVLRKKELDGLRVGPFSKEEEDILRGAVEKYVTEQFGGDREAAMRNLVTQRGREPSDALSIGRAALPLRHPKSIYNFIRRRIIQQKLGRWSTEEVYMLLEHYFKNENAHDDETKSKQRWRGVAQQIHRLPEQVHDKWKEIRPHIDIYRRIFQQDYLTKEERLDLISKIGVGKSYPAQHLWQTPDGERPTANSSQATTGTLSVQRSQLDDDTRKRVHEYIVQLVEDGTIRPPVVYNIPWIKVRDKFTAFSESQIRLGWTLHTFPLAIKKHNPAFSKLVVARCGIYLMHQSRKIPDRLSHVDFEDWFPQLPHLYVSMCVNSLLNKCISRFKRGTLRNADVHYARGAVVADIDPATLTINPQADSECSIAAIGDKKSSRSKRSAEFFSDEGNRNLISAHCRSAGARWVSVQGGRLYLTLKRQIRLAYCETRADRHFQSDMAILASISPSSLPTMRDDDPWWDYWQPDSPEIMSSNSRFV